MLVSRRCAGHPRPAAAGSSHRRTPPPRAAATAARPGTATAATAAPTPEPPPVPAPALDAAAQIQALTELSERLIASMRELLDGYERVLAPRSGRPPATPRRPRT